MKSSDTTDRALSALAWGRVKNVLAISGGALLFAFAGTPVALAGGGPPPPPKVVSIQKQVAVSSAISYGYGNAIVQVTQNQDNQQIFTPPKKQQQQESGGCRKDCGVLPFTGAQLAVFAIIGVALLLGGALLRVTSRRSAQSFAGEAGAVSAGAAGGSDPLEIRTRLAQEAARLGGLTNGARSRSSQDFRTSSQ